MALLRARLDEAKQGQTLESTTDELGPRLEVSDNLLKSYKNEAETW